ncbi:MAG: Dehydrogenase [Phormidesmis priestleyi Ana]|uniref:Dehydrogenase n=1 Tax=Phormidesmis priestleyi Ana TaxID=1666911 RepID=A0A0P7ZKY9_9CYAN|nr:MAG: Dehydrogenase [Phormidesmis priestleyi Ana]
MLQLLSQYFATRGDFLAQVIRADLRTLPNHKVVDHIATNRHNGHASDSSHSNGSHNNGSHGNGSHSKGHYNSTENNGHAQNGHHAGYSSNGYSSNGYSSNGSSNTTVAVVDSASPSASVVSKAPSPEAPSPQNIHDQVIATLVNLIVDKTGYPKESITANARLLDDLNLDSIKAGEVIAAAAKAFGVTGKLDPAALANVTLAEAAQVISAALPATALSATALPTTAPPTTAESSAHSHFAAVVPQALATNDVSQMILSLIEENTGFPQSSLAMDMRLLDDLNLDSIKAADLVAKAAKQLGIDGQLDPSTLANATLADVVSTLKAAATPTPAVTVAANSVKSSGSSDQPVASSFSKWVRNFAIDYVEAALPDHAPEDWSQAKVRLVADDSDSPIVTALATHLASLGGNIFHSTFTEILSETAAVETGCTHIIAVLPQPTDSPLALTPLPLKDMIARLKGITTLADATQNTCVAYVQFGGGYFGTGPNSTGPDSIDPDSIDPDSTDSSVLSPEVCCAAAFARSLHLERPSLRVRVIDLAIALSPDQSADLVIAELSGAKPIVTAGYDAHQVRRVPQSRLDQPIAYTPRNHSWSNQDVILVTGGAKGITAECAFAIAQSTGAKMALVGRSALPTDAIGTNLTSGQREIADTLGKYQQQDMSVQYYACDIADPEAVADLIKSVQSDLGPVTGVIHGAGLNTPRRVEQVSLDAAQKEVAPKLIGAQNLLQALSDCPPKIFLAFTSIIGITGMPGNSWYGFANETLSLLLRQFSSFHPKTQVVSLAYSVWNEVGMGARMGSVKNLERMGIGAISPQEGIERCLRLFHYDPAVQQVAIAARLGGLDTWSPLPTIPTEEMRFIEQIQYLEPGVELTVRTHLNLERDLYVKDHIWRGSYLFPTVFGLEAMAQAAAVVTGESNPTIIRLENISLRRPIVVNPDTGIEIEIQAEVTELTSHGERAVQIGIRTEQTGFRIDHFCATLILGEQQPSQKIKQKLGKPLAIEPKRDLYGSLLFQGELFQQIDGIFSLSREQSLLESHAKTSADLVETGFPIGHGSKLLLGDPYLRDVLLQCMQLNIPQDICLPVEIQRIDLCQDPIKAEGRRIITAILNEKVDQEYICEVIATDDAGTIVEHLQGYRLRILEAHPENPTAAELAHPAQRDHTAIQTALTTAAQQVGVVVPKVALTYAPALGTQPKKKRRSVEKLIVEQALSQIFAPNSSVDTLDFTIRNQRSGKPYLSGKAFQDLDTPTLLSISHDEHYCLCSVSSTPQGCDIEQIEPRSSEDWAALLSTARLTIIEQLVASGDDQNIAGMRVWSALEALHKAFNGLEATLHIHKRKGRAVLLQAQTAQTAIYILTLPVQLTRYPERMLALVVELPAAKSVEPVPTNALQTNALQTNALQTNALQIENAPSTDPYGIIRPGENRTRITEDGPQHQPVYEKRFPVTFKEGCSISRKVTVSQYISWVGKIRELPMRSMADKMIPDFLSGEFGMVTNSVSLRLLGEATTYDTIQARCWLGNLVNSSFSTYMEFCKVLADETLERVAIAEVNATWVRLLSYGIPSPEKMPDYLQDYMNQFTAKSPAAIDLKKSPTDTLQALPASLSHMQPGALQYQSTQLPYGDLMFTETFQTTLEESNLVGNVYYGNYFIWQGRVIDLFLYSLAPNFFRVSTAQGEVVSLYSHMNYMREAMPFDKVRVQLYLHSVTECGAIFNFEFFREMPNQKKEKLHTGEQEVIWANRQADGSPSPAPWPEPIRAALLQQRGLITTGYAAVK